jgi:hypothetical protein
LTGIEKIQEYANFVFYGSDLLFAFNGEAEKSFPVIVKIARGYEILMNRIPALTPYLIGQFGYRFTGVSLVEGDSVMNTAPIETSNSAVYRINSINVMENTISLYLDEDYHNEGSDKFDNDVFLDEVLVESLFHEFIHCALTTEDLSKLDILFPARRSFRNLSELISPT